MQVLLMRCCQPPHTWPACGPLLPLSAEPWPHNGPQIQHEHVSTEVSKESSSFRTPACESDAPKMKSSAARAFGRQLWPFRQVPAFIRSWPPHCPRVAQHRLALAACRQLLLFCSHQADCSAPWFYPAPSWVRPL